MQAHDNRRQAPRCPAEDRTRSGLLHTDGARPHAGKGLQEDIPSEGGLDPSQAPIPDPRPGHLLAEPTVLDEVRLGKDDLAAAHLPVLVIRKQISHRIDLSRIRGRRTVVALSSPTRIGRRIAIATP
jgi:hypothetical protein